MVKNKTLNCSWAALNAAIMFADVFDVFVYVHWWVCNMHGCRWFICFVLVFLWYFVALPSNLAEAGRWDVWHQPKILFGNRSFLAKLHWSTKMCTCIWNRHGDYGSDHGPWTVTILPVLFEEPSTKTCKSDAKLHKTLKWSLKSQLLKWLQDYAKIVHVDLVIMILVHRVFQVAISFDFQLKRWICAAGICTALR